MDAEIATGIRRDGRGCPQFNERDADPRRQR
jgi:hypothetical protein